MKKIKTPKIYKATKAQKAKKLREALILLNDIVKIKLAPSSIHGIGVFAMRDLDKGEKLYTDSIPHAFDVPYSDFDKIDPEIRELILGHWPQIVNGSFFLYPVTKFSAFINHSDDPNFDAQKDVTLREIKKGEEITENYKVIPNYKKIFPLI